MFDQASLIVSTQEDRWPFVLQKQKKKIAGPFQHTVIVILMVYSVSTMALSFVGNFCRWAPTQLHSAHLTLFFSPHLLPAWFPVFLRAYSWRCRIILHGVLLVGHLGFCCWASASCSSSSCSTVLLQGSYSGNWFVGLKILFFSEEKLAVWVSAAVSVFKCRRSRLAQSA